LNSITRPGLPSTYLTAKVAGDYRVREEVFKKLNVDKINNCFGCVFPKYQEYWLWVVGTGETYPSSVFVYSMLRDVWMYYEFSATTTVGHYLVDPKVAYSELIGTFADQHWHFDDSSLEGLYDSLVMCKGTSDAVFIDDTVGTDGGTFDAAGTWIAGTAIDFTLITRDFIGTDLAHVDRFSRFRFEAYGDGDITAAQSVQYVRDQGLFGDTQTITLTPEFLERNYLGDIKGSHLRIMFYGSGQVSFRWMQPYAIRQDLQGR